MDHHGETPLVWIEAEDLATKFLPAPFPPREPRGTLGPLVRSMRENGCICPIIARPAAGKLQVVCGYRRLIAAQAARLQAVPVLVREMSDDECRRLFAEENFHRIPHTGAQEPERRGAASSRAESGWDTDYLEGISPERLLAEEGEGAFEDESLEREDQAATLRRIMEKQRKASIDKDSAAALPLMGPEAPASRWNFGNREPLSGTEAQLLPVVLSRILEPGSRTSSRGGHPTFDSPVPPGGAVPHVHRPAGGPEPETAPPAHPRPEARPSEKEQGRDWPDLAMVALARRTEACFQAIRTTRAIPIEDVERIASDLIAMAPVRRGKDLRAFGAGSLAGSISAHSLLVAGAGIHLAEALEWTPGQMKKFALACLLHDIGMLFIPPELLDTPRVLDRSERDLVERHPDIGGEIIQGSLAWGAQVRLVAQDHHERWNGMGYPRRKKGKEVDLPSRMVAFLDCFGALVSPRPYRAPLLYSQAIQAMATLTEIGLHDPSILVHFRNVFTELPVGSCLRLKDGRIGRIVGRDPRNPRRHRLRVFDESSTFRPEPPVWIDSESISSEIYPAPSVPLA